MKHLILALTISPIFIATNGFSYSTDKGLIKINSEAAKGECLPHFNRKVNNVLKQNGIEVFTAKNRPNVKGGSGCQPFDSLPKRSSLTNPDDPRLLSVAKAVALYSSLGTGKMQAHKNIKVVFGTVRGPSRQCGDHVQLNPGSQNCLGLGNSLANDPYGGTQNIALIAHELGHQIANANGEAIFSRYKALVPKKCNITTYALKGRPKRPRSEEFAEVLAAYATNPGLFQGHGSACRKAFEFFAELFGETPENGLSINMSCESRKNSQSVKALHDFPYFPSKKRFRFAPAHYKKSQQQDHEKATPKRAQPGHVQ